MVKFRMMVLCVLIALPLVIGNLLAQEKSKNGDYTYGYKIDENGNKMKWVRFAGYPKKDAVRSQVSPNEVKLKDSGKALVKLSNVPEYDWSYGCTATATAMWTGYYDYFGAPNMYTGPSNGGVAPLTNATLWHEVAQTATEQCPIAASKNGIDGRVIKGHGDDYWTNYTDEATDPYYGAWAEHDYTDGVCTADYMGTNQWYNWGNSDGSTTMFYWPPPSGAKMYDTPDQLLPPARDGVHGMKLFIEAKGYTVDANWSQCVDGWVDADDPTLGPVVGGYTFADYKKSIDVGRPVIVGLIGHSVLGYGYDESYSPPRVYIRSTWYNTTGDTEYFSWGGLWNDMQHYQMVNLEMGTECYYAAPQNVFALNNNRVVTVTWDDPSKGTLGTAELSYLVFRDGSQIGTATTPTYTDNTASDGVHYYSVKAVYKVPEPDFTSYMSNTAAVYVSVSVTSFSDTFENTWGAQWLFNTEAAVDWGRDTQFAYAGTYSLGSSPGVVDPSQTENFGGSYAEVAPGLNFTTAVDAACTFYLKSDLEVSFDYGYFQACKDGLTWVTLKTWNGIDGTSTTFYPENISLGVFAGESNVRFRFLLVTDYELTYDGMNIDNFAITPSSVDTSAPFIFYEKALDYYTEKADGFEISTVITDYSGINYARVYYKVNGGTETLASAPTVNGTTYSWKLPVQTPGSLVEFRFECRDNAATPNTGTKGPFYYRDGLQQKFDYGNVSSYINIVSLSTAADGDWTGYANQFSSFHDDIVGAIVRGYAADGLSANAAMNITVWADNNGTLGAALITPLAFTNPATLTETNKWAYVDLSSYTALDNIAGTYYVGFQTGAGTSGITRSVSTDTNAAAEYDFKKAWNQWMDGTTPTWTQNTANSNHLRVLTTNYGITPGLIDTTPGAISQTVAPSSTASRTLTVLNIGGYPLDYTGSIDYTGNAGTVLAASNDFATLLTWTSSGTAWSRQTTWDGGSLNGTGFAKCSAPTSGTGFSDGYLTTPIINLSAYSAEGAQIAWIQKTDLTVANSLAEVQVSIDGTNWFSIYSTTTSLGAWLNGNAQSISVPLAYVTATTRFRFHAHLSAKSGDYFAIDNVLINGMIPYTWMTLDGSTTTSGTIAVSGQDPVTVGFNTAGLTLGQTYTANIKLNSTYSNESVLISLTVSNLPNAPDLVSPADLSSTFDTTPTFDWSDVTGATSYTILVDNDSDFSSPVINTSPTVSTYTSGTALVAGDYFWKVLTTNTYGSSVYTSTWKVTISGSAPPEVPTNITTAIVSGNLYINWSDAVGATSYDVYSSLNPYGTFTLLTNVTASEYTYTVGTNAKMFFYLVSKNSTKESPRTIEVKKPSR